MNVAYFFSYRKAGPIRIGFLGGIHSILGVAEPSENKI
jgi:hypothetical protein